MLGVDGGDDRRLERLLVELAADAAHLEPVDIVPERDGGCAAPEPREVVRRHVREHPPRARLEPAIACEQHRVEHALVQEAVPHPLADEHVKLVGDGDGGAHRGCGLAQARELLHHAVHNGDAPVHAVLERVRARDACDALRAVHAHHSRRAPARGKHRENPRPTPDVEHRRPAHRRRVLLESHAVRLRAHAIGEHHVVDVEVAVAVEIVLVALEDGGGAHARGRARRTRPWPASHGGRGGGGGLRCGVAGSLRRRRFFVRRNRFELEKPQPQRLILGAELRQRRRRRRLRRHLRLERRLLLSPLLVALRRLEHKHHQRILRDQRH
mmetsp:Transcript_9227/g.30455  ORF Transcript_9227/g.30455 Transcript_9227/m.30455 type:complete len:326 (+) Transcript_9227:542-1519(+)